MSYAPDAHWKVCRPSFKMYFILHGFSRDWKVSTNLTKTPQWFQWWYETLRQKHHLEHLGAGGDNIKKDLKETGLESMDCINLAKDWDKWEVLVTMVPNLRVPQNAGNFLVSRGTIIFSRTPLLHEVSQFSGRSFVTAVYRGNGKNPQGSNPSPSPYSNYASLSSPLRLVPSCHVNKRFRLVDICQRRVKGE